MVRQHHRDRDAERNSNAINRTVKKSALVTQSNITFYTFDALAKLPPAKRFCIMQRLIDWRSPNGHEVLRQLLVRDSSVLVRHEAAFALAQFRDEDDVPLLGKALRLDRSTLVRHEAALALGAIGSAKALQLLAASCSDSSPIVVQSCRAALALAIGDT